jgi:hypothetical protein
VHFNSTLPRDRIYALLGISQQKDRAALKVDYTAAKTDSQVIKETVVHFLRSENALWILQGLASDNNKSLNLPSWVPDLTSHPYPRQVPLIPDQSPEHYGADGGFLFWLRQDHLILWWFIMVDPGKHRGRRLMTLQRAVQAPANPSFSDHAEHMGRRKQGKGKGEE